MNPNQTAMYSTWALVQDQWDREVVIRWTALQSIANSLWSM